MMALDKSDARRAAPRCDLPIIAFQRDVTPRPDLAWRPALTMHSPTPARPARGAGAASTNPILFQE
jgi:hypothetical protein